ncbi:hypothetical protein WJX74_002082 [Apatococcus lobatus]|uniref:Dirigent protein n=1 Tax=Apatococcus lobatus TaxID=904363 RepID=A0AAW1QCQ5_9CHLO
MQIGRTLTFFSLVLLYVAGVAATGEPGTSQKVSAILINEDAHTLGEGYEASDIYQSIGNYHIDTRLTQPSIFGITGGTGIYATARGTYATQQLNDTSYTADYDILF